MKKIVSEAQKPKKDEPKPKYRTPEIRGTSGKASMSGAGCPSHTVQWQQVSCKC